MIMSYPTNEPNGPLDIKIHARMYFISICPLAHTIFVPPIGGRMEIFMDHMITAASDYILGKMANHNCGTIHSVYRKTINISFPDGFAALQAKGSPLSPISLITSLSGEEMAALPVKAGDPVSLSPGRLYINGCCVFTLKQVVSYDLKLTKVLSQKQLQILQDHICDVLSMRDAGSFELLFTNPEKALQIPFLAVAEKRLQSASESIVSAKWEEGAAELCRFVGLGLGLTPGGDDFLCGVLAGFLLCGQDNHPLACALRCELRKHLEDTNSISSAFLECAMEGQFSQAVNSLCEQPSPSDIFQTFSAIGHSSGTDTLCGITYLLKSRTFLS